MTFLTGKAGRDIIPHGGHRCEFLSQVINLDSIEYRIVGSGHKNRLAVSLARNI